MDLQLLLGFIPMLSKHKAERGSASTLITLGADGTHGLADEIHFITSGASQMRVASDGKSWV